MDGPDAVQVVDYGVPLVFEPQPLSILAVRFPKAVDHWHPSSDNLLGPDQRPTRDRVHVFDFDAGLRLLVTVEPVGGKLWTHLSATCMERSRLEARIARLGPKSYRAAQFFLHETIPQALTALTIGMPGKLEYVPVPNAVSAMGIPQWFLAVPASWPVVEEYERQRSAGKLGDEWRG